MHRRAVFLDRDGVLNEDHGYIARPGDLRVIEGAGAALQRLRSAGFLAVVVTNQSGIARGMFTERDLAAIHASLVEQLAEEDGHLDAIYYCPHLPEGTISGYEAFCDCRKPAPGMLRVAARELDVALADSFMVGDTLSDIEAGRAAGCRTIFVGGDGPESSAADACASDLDGAADLILAWGDDG